MKEKTLVANSIELSYGARTILSDIHLQCQPGQVIGILGHNGSGKSCLMKTIFGSLQPAQRYISVDGFAYRRPLYLKHNTIKYLPQNGYLSVPMKVKHVTRFFLPHKKKRKILLNDPVVNQIVETPLQKLSGGEKRYLESMLLLLSDASYVLLDEPFSKLYPLQIENLLQQISQCKDKGIIITDHSYHHLWKISDHVYFLKNGSLGKVKDKKDLEELGYVVRSEQEYTQLPGDFDITKPENPLLYGPEVVRELEIESSGSGGFSLLKLMNYTYSKGGEMVLQDILFHPRKSIAEIYAIQEATRFISENMEIFNLNISNSQLMTLETYLDSNIIVEAYPQAWQSKLAGIGQFLLNRNEHDIIAYGIEALKKVLQEISSLTGILKNAHLPAIIQSNLESFKNICENDQTKRFLYGELQFFNVLHYDYLFRKLWHQKLKKLIDSFYVLDALTSMAKAQQQLNLSYPLFSNSEKLNISGAFHPALKNPIVNDLIMDEKNLLFLTGANMAGKTTYLKSVALCVYLAHTGMAVPAQRMKLSLFDCIFTSLNTSDNIELGYSYFMNEANQVKKLALQLQEGNRIFAIMDELFRGTNVKDAYAGTRMVINGLMNWSKSNFLIATHLSELAADLESSDDIQFKFFEGLLDQQKITFNYQLKDGISNQHLGLYILKELKIDRLLNSKD